MFTRSVTAVPLMGRVTLRQLLGRRRTILLVLLAAVPVLLALVFRAANDADMAGFASGVLDAVAVTLLLPIVAVLFGTAAFGAEIEDGTILYLLAKPISRWAVVAAKFIGAFGVTAVLGLLSVLVSGAVVLYPLGEPGAQATRAFLAAMLVGSTCWSGKAHCPRCFPASPTCRSGSTRSVLPMLSGRCSPTKQGSPRARRCRSRSSWSSRRSSSPPGS
jgi:hypothetical protein